MLSKLLGNSVYPKYPKNIPKPFVIGVCGGSCGGKTTYCDIIKKQFNDNVTVIKQDWYYKGGDASTNFDHPDSLEFSYMIKQLKQLINGEEIDAPLYDFSTHSRKKETTRIKPTKVIVIDGILIFNIKELLELFDLKLYIEADLDVRYRRRKDRDIKERGRDEKEVNTRWDRDVKSCHMEFVEPSKRYANIIINNSKHKSFEQPTQIVQIDMILTYIKEKI